MYPPAFDNVTSAADDERDTGGWCRRSLGLWARDEYKSKFGRPPTRRDGAFDAPYGAPTTGPPPYEVYEVMPVVVLRFGTDEALAPRSTRWTF